MSVWGLGGGLWQMSPSLAGVQIPVPKSYCSKRLSHTKPGSPGNLCQQMIELGAMEARLLLPLLGETETQRQRSLTNKALSPMLGTGSIFPLTRSANLKTTSLEQDASL